MNEDDDDVPQGRSSSVSAGPPMVGSKSHNVIETLTMHRTGIHPSKTENVIRPFFPLGTYLCVMGKFSRKAEGFAV
jgi:hypothetical protein